jgi:hypothetical protein
LLRLLHAESGHVGQLVRDEKYSAHVAATRAAAEAHDALTAITARLAEAEQRLGHWGVDLVVGLLALAGFGVSIAADYVLNRAVVPLLLSVSAKCANPYPLTPDFRARLTCS